jgi:hypothetical protein
MYRPMTTQVPSASDSGMLRRGSLTSPAVNVMLFHASAENSEPVCETHTATNRPKVVSAESPGTMSTVPRVVHRWPKFAATASWFQPSSTPTRISPSSAPVFAVVKTFWMIFPYCSPRVLVHVSSAIITMPTSCVVDNDSA